MPVGTTSGAPQVLLAHHLKQLKLPTVLREYDKVARECARDGVDHPRYLLRLLELELIDRERRTVERRIRAARFPAVKSFDTFEFSAQGPSTDDNPAAPRRSPRRSIPSCGAGAIHRCQFPQNCRCGIGGVSYRSIMRFQYAHERAS